MKICPQNSNYTKTCIKAFHFLSSSHPVTFNHDNWSNIIIIHYEYNNPQIALVSLFMVHLLTLHTCLIFH